MTKTILVVGTYDTKDDELNYLCGRILAQGGHVLTMDVSVLGDPSHPTDISKHEVASAGGSSIRAAVDAGDENVAMQIMSAGASRLARQLYDHDRFDGAIILGGTMGTDLALDVCAALPLGVPKYIVSTVSFSPVLPPDRIAADVQMILWAGGLYGLNSVCKSSLSQAAGAVLGAARAVEPPTRDRPLVGMTSFGKTVLRYMVGLKPALESRGFEVAVFHATGMGGRAFESLAAEGAFSCVMDFAPQEVGNHMMGGLSSGADRLTNAGAKGIPQIIAPGCYDLIDFAGWHETPSQLAGKPTHAHNRLLSSASLDISERKALAKLLCDKLASAEGPVKFVLPLRGCNEWERPGSELYDPEGLEAFCNEIRRHCPDNVELIELDAHINDDAFCNQVLSIFDDWVKTGTIKAN